MKTIVEPDPCCWVDPVLIEAAMRPSETHHRTWDGWPCCAQGTSDVPENERIQCGGVTRCCKCLRDAGLNHGGEYRQ